MTTRMKPGDSVGKIALAGLSTDSRGPKQGAATPATRERCGTLIRSLPRAQRLAPVLLVTAGNLGAGAIAAAETATPTAAAADAPTAQSSGQLGEVIVTAQRRAENIQKVPITVTAVSSAELQRVGVTSIANLNVVAPSLNFVQEAAWAQPYIRGIGQDTTGPGIENSVTVYVDGVYQASMVGGASDFNNIDSVQVLSGPQGTLFGRNATGGAILITTKTPSHTFGGNASVGYGDYQTTTASAYVTGGMTANLAADLAVDWSNQGEGFGRNLFTGAPVDKDRKLFLRSKWLYTPSDLVTLTLAMDYGEVHFQTNESPPPGTIPLGGPVPSRPPHDIDGPYDPAGRVKEGGVALTADVDLNPLRFKSITAYRRTQALTVEGGGLSPSPVVAHNFSEIEPHEQVSQELQLLSPSDWRLHWTVGLYYFHEQAKFDPVDLSGPLYFPFTHIIEYATTTTNSYAAYGQATYDIRPDTHLTVGARYTDEPRSLDLEESLPFSPIVGGGSLGPFVASGSKTFRAPSWRVSLDHNFTTNILGYISYNRGFKSGGWNGAVIPAESYEPEKLDAYEAGVKTLSFDDHLRLNVSGFYYNDKNIQIESFPPPLDILTITNGPDAHLYGLDVIADAAITNDFSLRLGINLLHSEFASYPNAFTAIPAPGGGSTFSTFNAQGRPVPHAPKFTGTVGASYRIPTQIGSFALNADYYRNSGWNAEPDGRLHQEDYGVLNSQIGWTTQDGQYEVDVWGKNLQDTTYAYTMFSESAYDVIQYAPPRTYGVTLRANF